MDLPETLGRHIECHTFTDGLTIDESELHCPNDSNEQVLSI
jgi:hypothetical protein